MVVGDARVDERVLTRGGRVQLASETVEDLGDLERAEAVGALEQEVLDEVRHAGFGRLLVARAGADPVADGRRANVIEPLRNDAFARVELGQPPVLHGRSVVRSSASRPPARPGRVRPLELPVVGRRDGAGTQVSSIFWKVSA